MDILKCLFWMESTMVLHKHIKQNTSKPNTNVNTSPCGALQMTLGGQSELHADGLCWQNARSEMENLFCLFYENT